MIRVNRWSFSLNAFEKHARHHARFYISAVIGVLAWFASGDIVQGPLRFVIAGDTFFLVYLIVTGIFLTHLTPERMRKRSDFEDEGIAIIALITLTAVSLSLGAIFTMLRSDGTPDPLLLILSLCGVPLGWFTFHTVMASHYAHLYYMPQAGAEKRADARGLDFPATQEPGSWDFLYYSFVVGMTAQVSDVEVSDAGMRKMTLAHSVISFFYNTVLLALAVNVAVSH
ncbi:MAG: DUF1345 domain-containing protein [Parvibaculum sp.]|uniref:DUF1345 domain-containing protein n=1 Tax=Parvibaculum sp. TaxID=2024848 RepID=UPI003C781E81